ncbi:3-oxoacyl-[acyl-carrier protein] reductase [Candidatus Rhodobacter oscarellae]|uniref:3-oxoacyl-[acyl-carrier protein] reductase n=1 Tax=Candidatus Rhodobacter oscarellae TaxID=1675527 RepID=A0A0J9ED32_9RHOB|nr:SDR family oxidoreductase [Candidatus Rhodobacter lobularis]KMW59629.1 3-oxoacyl-[acyl-carrier protein] reductase [Candidatus Rhodobacter lobularis]
MELNDKTIIITGASSGIGAAAALLFASEGANVVLGARRETQLNMLVGQITKSNGRAVCLAGDVNDEAYAKDLVDLAEKQFGGLDGAFNNAGILGDMGPIPEMNSDNWQSVLSTNLTSAFFAAKAQLPAMEKRGGGAIVFTGTFVGYSNGGMPGMGAYAASKAGLIGFVQSLAADHAAQGIRINTILPGGTNTDMAGDDPATHELIAGLHPLKRMAEPREIAQSALFLLSDRASFITGSPVAVDGGMATRLL